MGFVDNKICTDQSTGFHCDLLVSDECKEPPEIELLKWICRPEKEDTSSVWEDVLHNSQKSKKRVKGCKQYNQCCEKGLCKKEKAVGQLLRFMKVIKENIHRIKNCDPEANCDDEEKYTSIEPLFVLAQQSAQLLNFEKKLKRLRCSQNNTCRLAALMKNVQGNILLQFICGPRLNEPLAKIVRDVAYIDCLIRHLEEICQNSKECVTQDNLPQVAIVHRSDKAENENKTQLIGDTEATTSKKEDKATSYEYEGAIDEYPLDSTSNKPWLYHYRQRNGSKATEFGDLNSNISYYYDVKQINRFTSTSSFQFEGDILYPNEEGIVEEASTQTEPCFTFHECYEITTTCVTYSRQKTVTELVELPKLENVTSDAVTSDFEDTKKQTGVKNYITKLEGLNILLETNTKLNADEMTVVLNSDSTTIQATSSNSPKADEQIISLKQQIFQQIKQVATEFVNNIFKPKER